MAAEQAKDRGNRAFSAGNFQDALACFSEAIALHERAAAAGDRDGSSGQLHVYYSNRSACHLKLGESSRALSDAEQCIALKHDWPRGYSRKGAALYQLARFQDAQQAYLAGMAVDPSNAALQEGLRSVQARLMAQASATSAAAASATAPAPSTARGARPKSLVQVVAGDKTALFQTVQFALRTVLLVAFLSYWLPVVLPSGMAFSLFFKVSLFNYGSYLMFAHGLPKWQAAYAQRLLLDPATQSFFYCLVFFVANPYGLAMVPVLLVEMVHFFGYLSNVLQALHLENNAMVAAFTTNALLPLTARIISEPAFATLPTQSKWAKLYHRMPQVAANVEVAIGLAVLFELLTPARNFLLALLYWQLLRVRYMISTPLQQAFRQLNLSILSLTAHPRCPAIVGSLYAKIQAFAIKMTDTTQQQQGAGASAPRCSIM